MIIMSVSKKKAKLYYYASLTAPYLRLTGGFVVVVVVVVVLNKIHEARAFATYETLFRFSVFLFLFLSLQNVWVQIHSVCLK